jgi:hypothetical protein
MLRCHDELLKNQAKEVLLATVRNPLLNCFAPRPHHVILLSCLSFLLGKHFDIPAKA